MNMTREQKLARANEIFDRVWGDEGTRAGYDALDVAAADLYGWVEELRTHIADDTDGYSPNYSLKQLVKEFSEIVNRLNNIELQRERTA